MKDPQAFSLGDWQVCPGLNKLIRGEQVRPLQARTMDLLVYLSEQSEVVSSAQILDALWPDRIVLEAAVHQRIAVIRKALGDRARNPRYIETVRGRGYRIIAAIERREAEIPAHRMDDSGLHKISVSDVRDLSRDGDLTWLAESLSDQLRTDLDRWQHIRVLPFTSRAAQNGAQRPHLELEGFVQQHRGETVLTIRLTSETDRSMVWSEEFRSDAEDDYELRNQLSGTTARYIGWSLADNWAPAEPAAYSSYLRLLNYRFYGDPDQNQFWLKQTMAADPDWSWGATELAMLQTRNAASIGDTGVLERTAKVLHAEYEDGSAIASAIETRTWQLCFYAGKPAEAEAVARPLAPYYGTPYALVLLSSGFAREAASFFQARQAAEPMDPTALEWLAVSQANLGNWRSAQSLTDQLAALYPVGWTNPQTIRSWTHRRTAHLPKSQALCETLREMMENSAPNSVQQRITAHVGYYPMAFEVAMANQNERDAQAIGDWFADNGYATLAAIVALRLHGKCPKAVADKAPNQHHDGFWWWLTRLHITPDIANHQVIRTIEAKLGYTPEWQAELARRASTLPPEANVVVAPDAEPIW